MNKNEFNEFKSKLDKLPIREKIRIVFLKKTEDRSEIVAIGEFNRDEAFRKSGQLKKFVTNWFDQHSTGDFLVESVDR